MPLAASSVKEGYTSFIWSGSIIFFGVNMSLLTLNGYDDGKKFIQEHDTFQFSPTLGTYKVNTNTIETIF